MEHLPTLTKQPDLVKNQDDYRPGVHEVGVLLHSAAYAAIQSPVNALTQPFGGKQDSFISPPEQAKPWTLDWNCQQIGTGIGMLAPILASRKMVTSAFPSATAELAAEKGLSALTSRELSALGRYELGVSIGTGLVYGGVFTPSKLESGQSLLDARMRQSASAGITFGTLTIASMGVKSLGQSESLKGTLLSKILKNDTAALAIAGVPAGIVAVDADSVARGKGLPSLAQHFDSKYLESIYNFSVIGTGLGMMTGPKGANEREPAAKPGLERAASDNALSTRSSADLLRELTTKLDGTGRVPDLNLDVVRAPAQIAYERDVRNLPYLKEGAGQNKNTNLTLSLFEKDAIETKPTPVRVYQAEGSPLKVVVPEEYALALDKLAELRKDAAGTGGKAESAKAELSTPAMLELQSRMNVQDAFRHALMTPEPGKFKEIVLRGESNPYDAWYRERSGNSKFESAADTVFKTGETTWYKKNNSATLVEDTMHEWAHHFDEQHPLYAQIIQAANRIDNLPTRPYAEVAREQLAILMGEFALNPDGKRVGQLMEAAPVTATAIGEGLHALLSKLPVEQRGPIHDQLLQRAEMLQKEARPAARQFLVEKIQGSPNSAEGMNALRALLYLGEPTDFHGLTIDKINLSYEPIADRQGSNIGRLGSVRDLDLSFTFINVETMRQMSTLPLENLNLAGTKITSPSLTYLPKTLRELDLSSTPIGDQSVPFLQRLQSLTSLDVSGTKISGSGMDKLRAALPKTKITD